jgi:hypothetical protein
MDLVASNMNNILTDIQPGIVEFYNVMISKLTHHSYDFDGIEMQMSYSKDMGINPII